MSTIKIVKDRFRWLFGGIGFHNSEASMTRIMSDKYLNEGVIKTFREISPTFSRVFAGHADWTREAMDAFADYYDKTFRKAGTLLYMVPGRMPFPDDHFDIESYCEKVATNLAYLVNERKLDKIRYYCVTNELSCGNTYEYLADKLDYFKELHTGLYHAFKRHGLDIGLLATDRSGTDLFDKLYHIKWAIRNIDEITEAYCTHTYTYDFLPGDLSVYPKLYDEFHQQVMLSLSKEKRFILGEYGLATRTGVTNPSKGMVKDVSYAFEMPDDDARAAITIAEYGLAAMNAGSFAAASWTMFDYPDPYIREMGESEEEKARYETAKFSGHGFSIRYNKHGLLRWCDDETDYSSSAGLYTMGYFAKLFRKGSRVLEVQWEDPYLRAGAVTNADGSMSVIIINWAQEEKEIFADYEHHAEKPFRKYVYEAGAVPYDDFNDLQDYAELVHGDNNSFRTVVPPVSVVFLTTDYVDRLPSEIQDITVDQAAIRWTACEDGEHCYYRVYKNGVQIASTVAEYVERADVRPGDKIEVYSVDKFGNCAMRKL